MRQVLHDTGLYELLLRTGHKVAETMVELFSGLPPGHEFFAQYSFIRQEDLPQFEAMLQRAGEVGLKELDEAERRALISLPFKLIAARHRLGLIDESFEARVVEARRHFAANLPGELKRSIEFFDAGDYPLRLTDEHQDRLIDIYRELNPAFVLTHSLEDPYNVDHPAAAAYAQEARIVAQAMGHKPQADYSYSAPPVFLFEPHQPEMCNFKPQVILNIDDRTELRFFGVGLDGAKLTVGSSAQVWTTARAQDLAAKVQIGSAHLAHFHLNYYPWFYMAQECCQQELICCPSAVRPPQ